MSNSSHIRTMVGKTPPMEFQEETSVLTLNNSVDIDYRGDRFVRAYVRSDGHAWRNAIREAPGHLLAR